MRTDTQCDKTSYYKLYKIMDGVVCLGWIQHHNHPSLKEPYYIVCKECGPIKGPSKMFDTWDECITWIKEV